MTHYSVVQLTPTDDAWIPAYLAAVGPLVEKHGGKYLARTTDHERLETEGPTEALVVILEWPSKDAEQAFLSDPGYSDHQAARLAGSTGVFLSVAGRDDMA